MKRPWYKWYPGDYKTATMDLDLKEDGFYRRALDAMWMNGGYIPADEKKLSLVLNITVHMTRICTPILGRYCRVSERGEFGHMEPMWTQDRLLHELNNYNQICAKRAAVGKKGANKRWQTGSNCHSVVDSKMMANANQTIMAKAILEKALSQKSEDRRREERPPQSPPRGMSEIEIMAKAKFEEARKMYRGMKRGLDTEWKAFKAKNPTWRALVHKLTPAIQREVEWKEVGTNMGAFVPIWPHFKVWINQKRWEAELPKHEIQAKKGGNDDDSRLRELLAQG